MSDYGRIKLMPEYVCMKKPDKWHIFNSKCEFYQYVQNHVLPESKNEICKWGNRSKKDIKLCHWTNCPRLKELKKKGEKGI